MSDPAWATDGVGLARLYHPARPMRILQVIPTLSATAGGPVEGLIQQGVVMTQAGHDVQTVCLDPPGSAVDPRLRSTAVYLLGPRYLNYSFAWRLEPWLRENARNYDAIIVHGIWTYHAYCTAKVARDLGVPYVVFLHGMLDPWFARVSPLKHIKKWLYWPWAEYRALRDAAFVLFTTAEELLLARDSFWLYKARERFVGYGIRDRDPAFSDAKHEFLARFPHLSATRNVLYLSRLHPKKGVDLLIRAFAQVAKDDPALHLVLAGPGDEGYVSELRSIVAHEGLSDRVTFTGMLRDAMKWGAYDAADVFALTSHQENFGIVLAEALASGLPVLTTRQVNIWREISQSGGGLIDEDTQAGANRLLQTWLALPQADRVAMRQAARACYLANFEVQNVTGNLLDALTEAASSRPKAHTFIGSLLRTSRKP